MQSLEIPNKLLINNFQYTFKKLLANEKYSFNRNICKILLTIDKEDINNIILKKDVYYNKNKHTSQM